MRTSAKVYVQFSLLAFWVHFFVLQPRAEEPIPISGFEVPELASLDIAILNYLREAQYPGLSIAVMRNGNLVFNRAYGWTHDRSAPLTPDHAMTLASISKVFTQAAMNKLIADGKVSGTAKLVDFLGISPSAGRQFAPGAAEITVDNVIDHASGLPEYKPDNEAVADMLGIVGRPASFAELISWQCTQPLLFAPGTGGQYSNFGYEILGVVIEKASGKTYGDYLIEAFGHPFEMRSIQVPPELQIENPSPATTLLAETYYNNAGAGGVQISPADMCRFMRAYRLNTAPKPRVVPGGSFFYSFYGSSAGALTVANQRISGGVATEFAVFCNARGYGNNDFLKNTVFAAIDPIQTWPTRNLFPYFTWRMDRFWDWGQAMMVPKSWAEDDFDSDGISNFLEYVHSLEPKIFSSFQLPGSKIRLQDRFLVIEEVRSAEKIDARYEILASGDLKNWTPIAVSDNGQATTTLDSAWSVSETGEQNIKTITAQMDLTDSTQQQFLQLVISPQ